MREFLILLAASACVASMGSPSVAQSGKLTIEKCVDNLLTPRPTDPAVREKQVDNPNQNPGNLPVPSVDTDNDGKISRQEAEVACSAQKLKRDPDTKS